MHYSEFVFLLCIGNLAFISNSNASMETHSAESNGDISGLGEGLFTITNGIQETPTTPNKGKGKSKQEIDASIEFREWTSRYLTPKFADSMKAGQDFFEKDFNNDPEKRNTIDSVGSETRRSASRGKKKKAKALGRLLMSSVSSKSYNDIQDDYVEDEDDDYSKGLNGEKMNWEDYRNEDGASVMELVALNTRHKSKNTRRSNWDEYVYR